MKLIAPKIKITLFNSRNYQLYWNYLENDTNNYMFIIFFDSGTELSFILRDLKKNKNIVNYIYKKLNTIFENIVEIETTKISLIEYSILKENKIPSVHKLC